jgi:hypothetical protein
MSLIFVVLSACTPTKSDDSTVLSKRINEILDEINTKEFWLKIPNYADYSAGQEYILKTEEACLLIENKEISLPLIFERFNQLETSGKIKDSKEPEGRVYDRVLALYFLIFKKTKSIESIPYLCRYLKRVSHRYVLSDKPLAVDYAGEALSTITDGQVFAGLISTEEDAERAEKWFEEYKKTHPE